MSAFEGKADMRQRSTRESAACVHRSKGATGRQPQLVSKEGGRARPRKPGRTVAVTKGTRHGRPIARPRKPRELVKVSQVVASSRDSVDFQRERASSIWVGLASGSRPSNNAALARSAARIHSIL
jgi:hypothetical protein